MPSKHRMNSLPTSFSVYGGMNCPWLRPPFEYSSGVDQLTASNTSRRVICFHLRYILFIRSPQHSLYLDYTVLNAALIRDKQKRDPPTNVRSLLWCDRWDLNPYGLPYAPQTYASACSATIAKLQARIIIDT